MINCTNIVYDTRKTVHDAPTQVDLPSEVTYDPKDFSADELADLPGVLAKELEGEWLLVSFDYEFDGGRQHVHVGMTDEERIEAHKQLVEWGLA